MKFVFLNTKYKFTNTSRLQACWSHNKPVCLSVFLCSKKNSISDNFHFKLLYKLKGEQSYHFEMLELGLFIVY